MKIIQFLFLFFISAQNIIPQSGWVKQNSGISENLNSVYFTDTNHGIIIGNNGTILRTADGGSNWLKLSSGTTNNLSTLSFIDSQTGFIWGSNRTFLQTNDGGDTWLNLSDSLADGLIPSAILDKDNAISIVAKNDSLKFYKTINGGLTWELFSELVTYHTSLSKAYYLDIDHILFIYSIAQTSVVYATQDGGKSWKVSLTLGGGSNGGFVDASFLDSKTGWVMDFAGMTSMYHSYIHKTVDGGKSWQKLSTSLPQSKSIYMIDSNNGFVVGNTELYLGGATRSAIYKTTNGGVSWARQNTNSMYKLNSVFFSNTEIGTIVGEGGLILRTTTGGIIQESSSWQLQNSGVTSLKRVVLTDQAIGYCIGNQMLKTTDVGISWQNTSFYLYGFVDDYDIWFADSKNGIMSSYVSIYSTSDGGNSWQETKTSDHLFGAFCTDNLHRIVVGWGGTIKYTLDGGNEWNSVNSGTFEHLKDVFFVNNDLGFIVGNQGTILRSDDGGLTWNSLESNTSNSLNGVFFTNYEDGVAVGILGTILRTSNGGETWVLQNSGAYNDLNSVFFKDENNGLIVGELGIILRTTDGGLNWTIEKSGTNNSLYGLTAKDSVELAVGEEGTILRNVSSIVTNVSIDELPLIFSIDQNYPNPFNPITKIRYHIQYNQYVSLKVYDLLGREIRILVSGEKGAGSYEVQFNGSGLASGVYFYRLTVGEFNETKKLVLMK